MNQRVALVCAVVFGCAVGVGDATSQSTNSGIARIGGTYVGTTPAHPDILKFIRADPSAKPELVEWSLSFGDAVSEGAPATFELSAVYGLTEPNKPGIARDPRKVLRSGTWKPAKRAKAIDHTNVIDLGGLAFARIGPAVIHVLNSDQTLMVGNGGWSYSLNRAGATEPQVDPSLVNQAPEMSYKLSPVSTGPTVYGVFEGRTPCQGIARELSVAADPACAKVKWRVTLYQDPRSHEPTTYKVEGGFFRDAAREGRWIKWPGGLRAPVFRLEPTGTGAPLSLLRGDDNVLFFADRTGRPLVGNALLNYTLDRRR